MVTEKGQKKEAEPLKRSTDRLAKTPSPVIGILDWRCTICYRLHKLEELKCRYCGVDRPAAYSKHLKKETDEGVVEKEPGETEAGAYGATAGPADAASGVTKTADAEPVAGPKIMEKVVMNEKQKRSSPVLGKDGEGGRREASPPVQPMAREPPVSPTQDGWTCRLCTFVNRSTRPSCEVCMASKGDGGVSPPATAAARVPQGLLGRGGGVGAPATAAARVPQGRPGRGGGVGAQDQGGRGDMMTYANAASRPGDSRLASGGGSSRHVASRQRDRKS